MDIISKEAVDRHHVYLERLQWSIINGIASLIYPKFVSKFKIRELPVYKILTPSIENIVYYLKKHGMIYDYLSNNFVANFTNLELFDLYYTDDSFFTSFTSELNKFISIYVLPNAKSEIYQTIGKKFGYVIAMGDTSEHNTPFLQRNDIMLEINSDDLPFIMEEILLNFIMYDDAIKKIEIIQHGDCLIGKNEIIGLSNPNDLNTVYFTLDILNKYPSVKETLEFVYQMSINNKNLLTTNDNHNIIKKIILEGK